MQMRMQVQSPPPRDLPPATGTRAPVVRAQGYNLQVTSEGTAGGGHCWSLDCILHPLRKKNTASIALVVGAGEQCST
jgi:hypothetical protein